jgi:hypothetical protein
VLCRHAFSTSIAANHSPIAERKVTGGGLRHRPFSTFTSRSRSSASAFRRVQPSRSGPSVSITWRPSLSAYLTWNTRPHLPLQTMTPLPAGIVVLLERPAKHPGALTLARRPA